MPNSASWQDVLDPFLVQRLLSPHPGRVGSGLANILFARYQPLTPLPLVEQLAQRQQHIARLQTSPQPIVYARPVPHPVTSPVASPAIAPSLSSKLPIVIQAKFVASTPSTTLPSIGKATGQTATGQTATQQPSTNPFSTGQTTPQQQLTGQPAIEQSSTKQTEQSLAPLISTQSVSSSALSKKTSSSPALTPTSETVEQLPLLATDVPDLPLIQPVEPQPDASTIRARRPRFERDIDRLLADLSPDLRTDSSHQTISVSSSVSSPMPSAPTHSSNTSIALAAQSLYPTVIASRSQVQHSSPNRSIPPVLSKLSQSREPDHHPELPRVEVRSPHQIREAHRSFVVRKVQSEPISSAPALPLVQTSGAIGSPGQLAARSGATQPLAVAAPISKGTGVSVTGGVGGGNGAFSDSRYPAVFDQTLGMPTVSSRSVLSAQGRAASSIPIVSAQLQPGQSQSAQSQSTHFQPTQQQPTVDVNALANKVERKLMRRLVVERERRGRNS